MSLSVHCAFKTKITIDILSYVNDSKKVKDGDIIVDSVNILANQACLIKVTAMD